MNDAYYEAFQRTVNPEVYHGAQRGELLRQEIVEPEYRFNFTFRVQGDHAVIFRLDYVKELATYLLGGKRAAGKDNDCTIIDTAVYLIEIKYTKRTRNSQISKQVAGGKKWLRHLLSLVVIDDAELRKAAEMPIYNVAVVMRRTGLSRSADARRTHFGIDDSGTHYRIEIPKGTHDVVLTKIMHHLQQNQPNDQLKI